MSEVWFTADTHFGHQNIIQYCGRPYVKVGDMDAALIRNWNRVVASKDLVYHLGDVFWWRMPFKQMAEIFNQLNGHKHLVIGNHDKLREMEKLKWGWINPVYELHIGGKKAIWLNHFAQRSWTTSKKVSWHLFGHSHGALWPHWLSCDVGVDSWNYTPVNLDTIREVMTKQQARQGKPGPKRDMWEGYRYIFPG